MLRELTALVACVDTFLRCDRKVSLVSKVTPVGSQCASATIYFIEFL